MSKLTELSKTLYDRLQLNPQIERAVHSELARMVSMAHTQLMASDDGFCFKFNLPLTSVNKLFAILKITPEELLDVYKQDWGADAMLNHMYKDSYYQILLLIIHYGMVYNKDHLVQNAAMVLMFKIWNGRRSKYLKFCDPKIMKYVVSYMCNNRYMFGKYDNPLDLINKGLLPTLFTKYGDEIKRGNVQAFFSQAWSRVAQLYVQRKRTNIETGRKEALGGILPLYMKAHKEGLSISSPKVQGIGMDEDGGGISFDKFSTTNNRDQLIDTTTNNIVMNPNTHYPPTFITFVRGESKVKGSTVEFILKSIHKHENHDIIHDILTVIFAKLNINSKDDICGASFMEHVKRSIISSKNNSDSRKIQQLVDLILGPLFTVLGKDFTKYSNVNQIQLRKVVIYGLIQNLRRVNCHTD